MKTTPRVSWGARRAKPGRRLVPASTRTEFIVHHSAGPADQSIRAIQDHHIETRKMLDIGYNMLVRGTTGQIYIGRGWDMVGAHATGHNTIAYGVCVIGTDTISAAAKDSLRWLFAEAVRRSGHPLKILGHRDVARTACPGDGIHRWLQSGDLQRPRPAPRLLRLLDPPLRGPDVRAVQLKVGATPDGIYGPRTHEAVVRWQMSHGLTPDGIVGPLTRAKLGL
jgi:hypothetical protein